MKFGGPAVSRFGTEVALLATLSVSLIIVGVPVVGSRHVVAAGSPPAVAAASVRSTSGDDADRWQGTVTSPSDPARRLVPAVLVDDRGSVRIDVDLASARQTWTGVGGALTDASVALLSEHPGALDLLFDPADPDGARLNLVRLPLSATDFSDQAWTWEAGVDGDRFRATAEAERAVAVVDEIVARQPGTDVTAVAWTAPDHLRFEGALRVDQEQTYAGLLAAQAAWLLERSVPLSAISLGNEPGHLATYPSMTMTDDQMIRMAELVSPALDLLDVELWALDHNWSDRSRVDRMLREAPGLFDAAAFHCYEGTPDQMAGLPVPVIVTECTGTDDNWTSTFGWDTRVLVAESIEAGSTGLMMWNLALTEDPRVLPGGCDACRGLVTVDPATGTVSPTPEFYTLAHLARAADPGAVVVATDAAVGVPTSAFVNPDGTVGIFGHNDSPAAITVEFDLSDGDRVTVEVGPWEMFSLRG